MANAGFSVVGDGYQAEVIVSGRHLRLFAEVYALGQFAVVYDVTAAREIARTDADNLEAAMHRAEG